MKSNFPYIALAKLCSWFGVTRQAYYQHSWEGFSTTVEEDLVLQQVKAIRKNHRRMGTRKIFEMLQPFMLEHRIKMGRDALFNMLSNKHLLVRKRRRSMQTTNSSHWFRKHPNLIRGFVPTAINQLWVSDITYWKIETGYVYISFITDVFSHRIVGYQVADTTEAIESIQALKMGLSALGAEPHSQLTHHSDRGIQYCSYAYVKLLKDNNIKISMTENGDPLENAVAERVNGIIKDEYLDGHQIDTLQQAKELLHFVVELYNNERPHMSIGNLTPNQIHHASEPLQTVRLWKNYYRKQTTLVNPLQD